MNTELLEELLHEEEGAALDFKRAQYPFEDADNDGKSELLKDILAFANAWRRSTAYVLLGVEEVKAGRSKLLGVSNHLDDAKLQQFVNSKTQRPVEFQYQPFRIEDVEMGIIEIPVQERPIYLTKSFARLKKETVYIRRGSSTAIATPDEIARMGIASVSEARDVQLVVDFGEGTVFEIQREATPFHFGRELIEEVIHRREGRYSAGVRIKGGIDLGSLLGDEVQIKTPSTVYSERLREWFESLEEYLLTHRDRHAVQFVVRNDGTGPAHDVELRLAFPEGVRLLTRADVPEPPRPPVPPDGPAPRAVPSPTTMLARLLPYQTWIAGRNVSPIRVARDRGVDFASIRFKKIPQHRRDTTDPLWIEFSNAVEPFSFGIDAYLLADEIPEERINELHIVVADPFNDVSPTAQDIDHLLDQWAALKSAPDG